MLSLNSLIIKIESSLFVVIYSMLLIDFPHRYDGFY